MDSIEKKISRWGKIADVIKSTLGSFKSLLMSLIVTGLSFYYAFENKEAFIQDGIKGLIHKEVVTETNESYSNSELRQKDSVFIAEQIKLLWNSVRKNKFESHENRGNIKGNKDHCKFNTNALTITSSALLEEMDKRENGCGWTYHETNGGDDWAMFDCQYSSQILYSVDLRSDCRAYYTPIGGGKTKIKF